MRHSLVVTLLAFAIPCAAQGKQITLEELLSAPFADALVAAPAGGAVAWTFDDAGSRNVWVARPPDYKARKLTSYTGDDGQELSELTFTPDGNAIAYVRGGNANGKGEVPNPALDVEGVTQAVWLVQLSGGAPRRVGEGRGLAISSTGERVAFVKGGEIWEASLRDTMPASQLMHTRGRAGELRWSPKGERLAFVSERGDHNFVGVYDGASKTLRYLSPSVDWDSSPVWSPDGARVAFIARPPHCGAHRSGQFARRSRGRSSSRMPRPARGTRCGKRSRARAAHSAMSLRSRSSCGRRAIGSCFRGSAMAGRISTR